MWYEPPKYIKPVKDINIGLRELKGELEEKEAKITLAQFLYRNLGVTTQLLTGIELYPDQIITIKGMLKHNYTLCVWGRGVSKSVSYNETYVIDKDEGFILLKDLFPNLDFSSDKELDIPTRYLWNGLHWQPTSKLFVQPKKPCLSIRTKRGYVLKGAITHKVKTWNRDRCEIEWKTYNELTQNDTICISRTPLEISSSRSQKDLDDSYLIGLFLGDGHIPESRHRIIITTADKEISDFCLGYGAKIKPKKNTTAWDLNFSLITTNPFLDSFSLKRGLSYDKFIPPIILRNTYTTIACLQALFDTDGCIATKRLTVEYCSTSIKMAEQVHLALLTFGIMSHLSEYKTPSPFGKAWKVVITGYDCQLFAERIGFRLSRKQNQLLAHLQNHDFNSNIDVIPGLKDYCQREIKSKYRLKKEESTEWRNQIRRKNNQKEISYDTLGKYVEFFEKTNADAYQIRKLKQIQEQNLFFDQVESIEDLGSQDCIDFNIPDGEQYWSNGFISHNTWTAAVYSILQSIFFPGTTILIAGPTFRTSRFIFNHIEKICDSPEAHMLAQAFGAKIRRNDEFRWSINGGEIVAIPLNGEKIRGFRANVLLIDEFLLMSEEIVEKVLIPYLVVPKDIRRRKQIREKEDELIRRGVITEEDRTKFLNEAKLIALSSASYTCEYLYRKYDEYVKQIYSPDLTEHDATYFVSQVAWDAIPEDRIDKSVIELAQTNESNMATFQREYCAQFLDGSDSYFSMKKMIDCTVPDGQEPTLKLAGEKDKKYLLSIDPNFSNSPTADDFAMCVIELDNNKLSGTIVHSYAESGRDLKDHIRYFYYLWKNFNIEMIVIDYAGYQFIEAANENELFRQDGTNFKIFDFVSEKDGDELHEELRKARASYNKQMNRIVFTQYFTTDFIRKANEWLQGCIDYKRIWFGGGIKANIDSFNKALSTNVNLEHLVNHETLDKYESPMGFFIDNQEVLIKQTKYQAASIEVKTTARGVQSFDLPQIMKRDSSQDRMRRDSYTALMLGTWGMKCYRDIMETSVQSFESFEPVLI